MFRFASSSFRRLTVPTPLEIPVDEVEVILPDLIVNGNEYANIEQID